jgi:hypothetical protein
MSDHSEQEITFSVAGVWLGLAAYIVLGIIIAAVFI